MFLFNTVLSFRLFIHLALGLLPISETVKDGLNGSFLFDLCVVCAQTHCVRPPLLPFKEKELISNVLNPKWTFVCASLEAAGVQNFRF